MSAPGMKRMRGTVRGLILGLILIGFSACSSSKQGFSDEDLPEDISWLTMELHNDGIFVAERGQASRNVLASLSRRLVLNGREVVDAYFFENSDIAAAQATIYAGYNPRATVYVHDQLMVIRYRSDMSEVSSFLYQLLGKTI